MIVGLLTINIRLHGIGSLKDKRKIVKSLIGRLRSRFNVSVSETDRQESRQDAVIGVATVSNDGRFVNRQLDTILGFVRRDGRFYVGTVQREVYPSGQ